MFKQILLEDSDALNKLLNDSLKELCNSIYEIEYPNQIKGSSKLDNWRTHYHKIDTLNSDILSSLTKKPGVYIIWAARPNKDWQLKYIGQTNKTGSKHRIRSHIVWRNKRTNSGNSTGSKFDEVRKIVGRGYDIAISFVEISPASLRHYVEEELIHRKQPPWNLNGTTLSGQRRNGR